METKTNAAQPTEFIIPKTTISWHFERKLKPDDRKVDNYVVIQPGAEDVTKVLEAYTHHPVSDYNIASIEIVYNANLNQQFFSHMKLMNKRKGNPKFISTWRDSTIGKEKAWREATYRKLQTLSASYGDRSLPNVMLLPLWHGTSDTVSGYILDGGYGIFSSNDPNVVTDKGFFGKGVYATHEAEYAFRVYAKQHRNNAVLLLNWVSIYEAYPVIHGDIPQLEGKMGGYDQCDAHFIPVRSDSHPDPETKKYDPCAPEQEADYHEVVVFAYQQCLPRYRVKLTQNAPRPSLDDTASLSYQSALISLNLGQYEAARASFEEAAEAGHPGAAVRLHWWYSGGSGIIRANPQALQNWQTLPVSSVNILKQKANFRGDNDQESQFTLAWCYQHGLGCEVDLAKAAKYYWIAAQDYRQAHQNAAMQVYRAGYRDAQYELGMCCAAGIGVKQDVSQAITWCEQAAKQRHIHARYVLSQCYELGLGTKANPTKALTHKQAAQEGQHPQLISISPNVQLEQEVKQLKQQLAQQTMMLKEKELQLTQQTSTLKQKELELTQEKLKLKQQQDKAVQDQQKIKELAQAVSTEQQASRSKDELIARQKEEQKKKDEIIVKQNQEKATQEAQLRDREQLLQQQTQKATDLSEELQLTQQELSQKDEMLTWFEIEQLKKDLAESKKREVGLKREFEVNKANSQLPILKQEKLMSGNYSPTIFKPEPQKVLNFTVAKEQNRIRQEEVQALLKWVTEGHLVEVEKLLKKNPSLSVCTGTVTDRSDRAFKNITALQYAAWSLDREMCDLIIGYVGAHNSAIQLKALYAEPDRYSPYGDHYDIKPLITKTKTYLENCSKWNIDQCYQYWKKEVGGEQRKCPAWLIYAWNEEGKDVAWTTQDFSRKVKREYDKNWLDWWFTENYNNGRGVGLSWAAVRGPSQLPSILYPMRFIYAPVPYSVSLTIAAEDASCQMKLDIQGAEQLAKLKSLSETYATTSTILTPVKK